MLEALVCIPLLALSQPTHCAREPIQSTPTVERALAACFPETTFAYAELANPRSLLQRDGFDALLDRAGKLGALPTDVRQKIDAGLALATWVAGDDPFELGAALAAGGLAVGLSPSDASQPVWSLVMRGDDTDLLERMMTLGFARVAPGSDLLSTPHERVLGADVWNLGAELSVARHGATLYAAGNAALLHDLLQRADAGGAALATQAEFALPEHADLAVWLDRKAVAQLAKGDNPLQRLDQIPHLPEVQFLLGAGLAELMTSNSFGLGVDVSTRGVAIELTGHAPNERTGLAPTAAAPAPRLASAASMAWGQVHRDLDGIVRRRNQLFAPELQPRFSKVLGELAIFFGGIEIEEDLLPAIGPWVEVGVASMDFGAAPRPDLAMPGLVALFDVDPVREPNLMAAFQTAISIGSAERAQNGLLPYVLTLKPAGDAIITTGQLPPPAKGDGVDMAYNLAPACAFFDGTLVLGTHEAIVRAALQDLAANARATATDAVESIHLSGAPLADLVQASREYLIMGAVLNDGKSRREAESDIHTLTVALQALDHANISLTDTLDRLRLKAELILAEPLTLQSLSDR
jgi:hypothetical protein